MIYTKAETAKELKVSTKTVDRLIADGRLKASKVGRQIRVRPEHIKDYLDEVLIDPNTFNEVLNTTNVRF